MAVLKQNWENLIKPSISLKEGYNDFDKSVIVVEPFERGFGNSFANSLRRIMLSSVSGFAVTSLKINGIVHEYSSIDGVFEDVVDIIMNIKNLAITKDSPSSCVIRLSHDRPGPVYAGFIQLPAGVDIFNKDLKICTLAEGGRIDIEMKVEFGRGYYPVLSRKEEDNEIGLIPIDATFSPVKRVSYKIETSRVGQITDYDKLVLEIQTNGTVSPRDVLATSARIMQDQLSCFVNFRIEEFEEVVKKEPDAESDFNINLLKTIEELELSVRSYNCLKNESISYVGDLVIKTESEMLKMANFGRKSLNELKDNLRSMNLSFGMKLVSWPPKNLDDLLKIKNKEF